MKIEIWSDIMCPFCYIGKRKFEHALQQFAGKDQVEVVWHSYLLDPQMQAQPGKSIYQVLADKKGWSLQQSRQAHEQVIAMAREVGLHYQMDQVQAANTYDAHRLIQMAKAHQLQDQAEERLFSAYFMEGRNLQELETLVALGKDMGLPEEELRQVLAGQAYSQEVQRDLYEARQIGIRGVPFFLVNQKYGISGAQPSEVFLQALNQAWQEEQVEAGNQQDAAGCGEDFCV
ncbi:MAG: DsbA family oxidoreductase [Adhaeribacter sp.]